MTVTISPDPRALGLPHDSWRPGQREAVEEAVNAEEALVLISAPVGTGKSDIAAGIAAAQPPPQGSPRTRAVIATKTHQLQAQYQRDFPYPEMKGARNYPCPEGFRDGGECSSAGACTGACPLGAARQVAKNADVFVTNYDYVIASLQSGHPGPLDRRTLLLGDEGHAIDESLRSATAATFSDWTRREAEKLGVPMPRTFEVPLWRDWTARAAEETSRRLARLDVRDPLIFAANRGLLLLAREVGKARRMFGRNEPVVPRADDQGGTVIEPVFAWDGFADLARHFPKIVLLSATLPEPGLFEAILGATGGRLIEVPSLFDPARRPFHVHPVVNVRRGMDDNDLDTLVEAIDGYLDFWPDRKGILHTHAYWVQRAIESRTRHRGRLIGHDARGLLGAVRRFAEAPGPVWLMSPVAHSGVDLPYEQVRSQLICKLPTPDLGDPTVQARQDLLPESYPLAIAQTVMQAYGRGMRAPDDWCQTVMLDKNWLWWFPKYKHLFRPWFTEAVRRRGVS